MTSCPCSAYGVLPDTGESRTETPFPRAASIQKSEPESIYTLHTGTALPPLPLASQDSDSKSTLTRIYFLQPGRSCAIMAANGCCRPSSKSNKSTLTPHLHSDGHSTCSKSRLC